MTQNEMVLKYMTDFGSITPLEAIRDLGVYRLSARIANLREDGHIIRSELVSVNTRYGKKSHVARYSLVVN